MVILNFEIPDWGIFSFELQNFKLYSGWQFHYSEFWKNEHRGTSGKEGCTKDRLV